MVLLRGAYPGVLADRADAEAEARVELEHATEERLASHAPRLALCDHERGHAGSMHVHRPCATSTSLCVGREARWQREAA